MLAFTVFVFPLLFNHITPDAPTASELRPRIVHPGLSCVKLTIATGVYPVGVDIPNSDPDMYPHEPVIVFDAV